MELTVWEHALEFNLAIQRTKESRKVFPYIHSPECEPLMTKRNWKRDRFREVALIILQECQEPLTAFDLCDRVRNIKGRSLDIMSQAVRSYLAGDDRFGDHRRLSRSDSR